MKIKTMLQLFFLVSTLIVAGLVSVVFLQKNNLDRMVKKEMLANEIVKVVNQREDIINDYINYHKSENIILWQLMYEITGKLLQSNVFDTPEEQA